MKTFLVLAIAVSPLLLLAENPNVIPDSDPVIQILELIKDWGTLAFFTRVSLILVVAVQLFKKLVPNFIYMRTVVTIIGIIVGFLHALSTGMSWYNAAVFTLITSGGAVAIYQLFKNPLNKAFGIAVSN